MRKAIIILTALAAAALAYWGYIRLSGTATLDPPASHSAHELELPATSDSAQRVGETVLHGAEQTNYITRDPATRQISRVFGFSRLKNPGAQSAYWEVDKPHLIFYEPSYQCRIDADNGLIQTERIGTSISPRDGRLDGNVVIRIRPQPGSRMAETTILMDDVMFSSERTEFSTDGPVQVISSQIELSGRGLVLLINAIDGQVDYLHILDLESLRLRDFVQAEPKQPAAETQLPPETPARQAQAETSPRAAAETEKTAAPSAAAPAPEPNIEQQEIRQRRLYQCVIEDNVMIRYGDQLVVAGADQVNIQNILFAQQPQETESSAKADPIPAVPQNASKVASAAPVPKDAAAKPLAPQTVVEKPDPAAAARDESRDVVVTCNGVLSSSRCRRRRQRSRQRRRD
jgi:hypothetical protein